MYTFTTILKNSKRKKGNEWTEKIQQRKMEKLTSEYCFYHFFKASKFDFQT